jgi:hypothetical protein
MNIRDNTSTRLINHANDVSFMGDYKTPNNTTEIILSKGLRTSVIEDALLFHKPGDTITDNNSLNQLKLPLGTDLSDLKTTVFDMQDYISTVPKVLFKCYNSFADIPTTVCDYETLLHCYKSNVFSRVAIMYSFQDTQGFFPSSISIEKKN